MKRKTPSALVPKGRGRLLAAMLAAWLPTNGLRVRAYRHLLGYRIGSGTRIGLGTIISCESFACGAGLLMGRNNRFNGPFEVRLGDRVVIGRANMFVCGHSASDPAKAHMNYARRLTIGDDALIFDEHYFDVYGLVSVGAGTWVAGIGSQFWTHGASAMDRDIHIGAGCYLGAAVRMAPGSAIGDGCVLGLGSVVVSRIDESNAVLAGFPARKLRTIEAEDERAFVFQLN